MPSLPARTGAQAGEVVGNAAPGAWAAAETASASTCAVACTEGVAAVVTTRVPVEHLHPVGTVVRHAHGKRRATIVGVSITYDRVYRLRYLDNGQEATRPIREVDAYFVVDEVTP